MTASLVTQWLWGQVLPPSVGLCMTLDSPPGSLTRTCLSTQHWQDGHSRARLVETLLRACFIEALRGALRLTKHGQGPWPGSGVEWPWGLSVDGSYSGPHAQSRRPHPGPTALAGAQDPGSFPATAPTVQLPCPPRGSAGSEGTAGDPSPLGQGQEGLHGDPGCTMQDVRDETLEPGSSSKHET